MLEDLGKDLLKIAFAGVGAVAVVAERACDVGKVLVQKGEETVEQGRAMNEELQHKAREAYKERRNERLKADVEAMTAGEREELRRKLAELDELEKQAAEAAAEAEQAEAAKITEIHCDKHDDGCDGE